MKGNEICTSNKKNLYGRIKRNDLTSSFIAPMIVYNDLKSLPGMMLTFMVFYLPYQPDENSSTFINII